MHPRMRRNKQGFLRRRRNGPAGQRTQEGTAAGHLHLPHACTHCRPACGGGEAPAAHTCWQALPRFHQCANKQPGGPHL